MRLALRSSAVLSVLAIGLAATATAEPPTIAEHARGLEKRDGFLPLHWDAAKGRLLLEVQPGQEVLYLTSLATGLGDPETGINLDRGTPAAEALARFERSGPRLHLVLQNPRFRASVRGEALARSVEESFVTSTVGAFEILAEEDGRVLADATPLFLSDVVDVRRVLRETRQGSFQLDREKSRIHLDRTRGFPDNTEVEAALTFTTDEPGPRVRMHAPEARAITLRQHHSFVRLPGPGFQPRAFDPRIGAFAVAFHDFARPFHEDPVRRSIVRHRLVKKDPAAPLSEPVKPIVYYLDPAVPEPYRTAFREGALWWNGMFERAGFKDAFRVENMPPDMDPMDARYHVIQWMHRSGPAASVGPSFVDPRTGELIKAAVRMDSHRSLVNYDLYAALLPAMGKDAAGLDPGAEAFAMARRRQHAAHEVGHTLGFAHNFAAAVDERASVMAYPAPLIRLVEGRLDLSQAYEPGPGEYDALLTRYSYTEFASPAAETAGLRAIVDELTAKGLRFATNPDEGPDGSFPEASVWVNGRDPVEELARMSEVRRFALERFDDRAIRPGEPMALLNRRLAWIYFLHADTLAAAVKAIGGMEFRYGVRGDPLPPTRLIEGARQRRALELALDALEPPELAVPERVIALIAPRPFGYEVDPTAFSSVGGTAFDPLGAARGFAHKVLAQILSPARTARLAAFAARDKSLPSVEEVVGRVVDRVWGAPAADGQAALRRVVQRAVADELLALAASAHAPPESRAAAEWGLRRVAAAAGGASGASVVSAEAAHRALVRADIARFLERREAPAARPDRPATPRRPWPGGSEGESCSNDAGRR